MEVREISGVMGASVSMPWDVWGSADRRCFYSRKSFFFPDRQQGPHRGWNDEVKFLDGVFGECLE